MIFLDIKKKAVLCVWFVFAFQNSAIANHYDSIEYKLSPNHFKEPVLHVEATLNGKFKDKLVLDLPSGWAGTDYSEQIKNIQISPDYTFKIIKNISNHQAIIDIPIINEQIKIKYEIHQKSGNPSNVHEAIIRNNLIHSVGYGLFAVPSDLNETEQLPIAIKWRGIDKEWKTLSSYGISQNININSTIPKLLHAIYVAGKLRIYKIGDTNNQTFLSLYGNFDIQDKKIIFNIKEIIRSQRRFFNDFEPSYYAISLIEGEEPRSMGGTGLNNSFTAFLPKEEQAIDYYMLFAHEHLHNWLGDKIKNDENEELNYWWSEGFTDFYSRLIAARSGGINTKIFIKEINKFLRLYYLSPVNREPNLRIKQDFWKDPAVGKLPYYRGFVLAIYLNHLIIQENHSNSLDNVMHDIFKVTDKQCFSQKLFEGIVYRYVKPNAIDQILRFIDQGDLIALEDTNLPIERVLIGRYYLGFDQSASLKDRIVKQVDEKSNAYKAGLRNGQKMLEWDISGGPDPDQIITIKTTDGTVQFKPEHYEKVEAYQLKQIFSKSEKQNFCKFFKIKRRLFNLST